MWDLLIALLLLAAFTIAVYLWFQSKIGGYVTALKEKEKELEECANKRNYLISIKDKLEGDIKTGKVDLEKAKEDAKRYQKKINTKSLEISELETKLEGIEYYKKKFEEVEPQITSKETEINRLVGEIKGLDGKVKENNDKFVNARKEIDTLNEQIASLQRVRSEYNSLKLGKARMEDKIEDLKKRLAAKEAELADNTSQAELEARIQLLETELASLKKANLSLADTHEKVTTEKDTLLKEREEFISIKGQYEVLSKDHNELRAELQKTKIKLQDANASSDDTSALQTELEAVRASYNRLKGVDDKYTTLNTETEQLRKDLAAAKAASADVEQLRKDLADCRASKAEVKQALSKEEEKLAQIRAKASLINFEKIGRASETEKDDLKRIKGVGPFLEKKLNALGIFTFRQIANLDDEMEEKVNDAIEFFPGRIKRDEWAKQAKELHNEKLNKG